MKNILLSLTLSIVGFASGAIIPSTAFAQKYDIELRWKEGAIQGLLRTEPDAVLSSSLEMNDVELCIADALGVMGVVVPYNIGKEDRILAINTRSGDGFGIAVHLRKKNIGIDVIVRVQGKGWDDRAIERIKVCIDHK